MKKGDGKKESGTGELKAYSREKELKSKLHADRHMAHSHLDVMHKGSRKAKELFLLSGIYANLNILIEQNHEIISLLKKKSK